jgi:hypothetical protein
MAMIPEASNVVERTEAKRVRMESFTMCERDTLTENHTFKWRAEHPILQVPYTEIVTSGLTNGGVSIERRGG